MRAKHLALTLVLTMGVAAVLSARAIAAEAVDLELVIAADVSSSIDDREAALEREGTVSAFRSPKVVNAIQQGALGKIAVLYIDWSGGTNNVVVANWHRISDKASAAAFADALERSPRTYGQGTDIGAAIQEAATLITASSVAANGFNGTRKAIDISGDGPANRGRPVADVRDEIVKQGIIINGLPIVTDEYGGGDWGAYPGQLDLYYQHCIIGGHGAFILPAKGFPEFVAAMRKKLVIEISSLEPQAAGIVRVAARMPPASVLPRGALPSMGAMCGGGQNDGGFGRGFGGGRGGFGGF